MEKLHAVRRDPRFDLIVLDTPPTTNDAVVAELNRQREITARVMQEATKLAQSYGELQSVLGEIMNVARNNALLNLRLATNELRVAEFDRELRKLSASPASITNDMPAFSPELPAQSKP